MFRFLDKKHLCITQALVSALATIWLIWLENFRLLSVQMPRSLAVSCWDVGDADQQFKLFSTILEKAVESCVPGSKYSSDNRHNRAPMDKAFRKLNRRKNRLWTRYMETRDISKYRQYCQCRNKVRSVTRSTRREYEKQIALKAQTEPKNFWKYANSISQSIFTLQILLSVANFHFGFQFLQIKSLICCHLCKFGLCDLYLN